VGGEAVGGQETRATHRKRGEQEIDMPIDFTKDNIIWDSNTIEEWTIQRKQLGMISNLAAIFDVVKSNEELYAKLDATITEEELRWIIGKLQTWFPGLLESFPRREPEKPLTNQEQGEIVLCILNGHFGTQHKETVEWDESQKNGDRHEAT
jgi:hypothetical protein